MPRGYWAELYELPHLGVDKVGELEIAEGFVTSIANAVGEGKVATPVRQRDGTIVDLDTLLDPVSNLGVLVKIMQADPALGPGLEVGAFRIDETSDPYEETGLGPHLSMWGGGIEAFLEETSLPNFDDPTQPTLFPDHMFGAPSILANGGIEDGPIQNAIQTLGFTVNSGSFTLSDGVDTTSSITLPTDYTVVGSRLETDIASIIDVFVTGIGTVGEPFNIEFLQPGGVAVPTLILATAGGAAGTIQVGATGGVAVNADPWTPSYHPQTGAQHGTYNFFGPATDQVHSGTYSLKVISTGVPPYDYSGAQQQIPIGSGSTNHAGAWVRCTVATTFVVAIRTLDETTISIYEQAVAANTWTLLTVPTFVNLVNQEEAIFRIAVKTIGTEMTWWIDDATFSPGLPADTAGYIAGHCLDRIQAAGDLTWLGRTFGNTVDSNGIPWVAALTDMTVTIDRGRNMKQVLDVLAGFGATWTVTPDGSGGYELNLYNPGTFGTDRSDTVKITGGQLAVERAQLRRLVPRANRIHAEGVDGVWTTTIDSAKASGYGQRTLYVDTGNITDSVSLLAYANAVLAEENARHKGTKIRLRDDDELRALQHFDRGDLITIDFPPDHIDDIQLVKGVTLGLRAGQLARAELHMQREVLNRAEIDTKAILRILTKFQAKARRAIKPSSPTTSVVGGGSAPTVVVAAFNAPASTKERADVNLICTGVNDHLVFDTAVSQLAGEQDGRIVLTEGDYWLGGDVIVSNANITFVGMGAGATRIHMAAGANSSAFVVGGLGMTVKFADIGIDGQKATQTAGSGSAIHLDPNAGTNLYIEDCDLYDFRGPGLLWDRAAGNLHMTGNRVFGNQSHGLHLFFEGNYHITDNDIYSNGGRGISCDAAREFQVTGNRVFGNTSYGIAGGGIFQADGQQITENYVYNNGHIGIYINGHAYLIAGNWCTGNTNAGIGADGVGSSPLITGNHCNGNAGNGFTLDGASGGTVVGNYALKNDHHGIYVTAGPWAIKGNTVESNGRAANNTYDGIQINGDKCDVVGNTIRQDNAANKQRYGINITANADATYCVTNAFRAAAGWGTANAVNNGTNTVLTVAGPSGFGDNY